MSIFSLKKEINKSVKEKATQQSFYLNGGWEKKFTKKFQTRQDVLKKYKYNNRVSSHCFLE